MSCLFSPHPFFTSTHCLDRQFVDDFRLKQKESGFFLVSSFRRHEWTFRLPRPSLSRRRGFYFSPPSRPITRNFYYRGLYFLLLSRKNKGKIHTYKTSDIVFLKIFFKCNQILLVNFS